VIWRRWFGRPSGLGAGQTVWLCVEGLSSGGSVALNGAPLGRLPTPGTSGRYDVTSRLLARNELAIHLEQVREIIAAAQPAGEVRLEICSGEASPTPAKKENEL